MKKPSIHTRQAISLSASILGVLLVGTIVYHEIENLRWIDAFYFSVITLTTIGYGDIAPSTDFSKLFTILYAFIGIGFLMAYLNLIGNRRIDRLHKRSKKNHEKEERE